MVMWDSILLAYSVRSRVIPPGYRKLVTRSNGDVPPTLLVHGYVASVWRLVEGGIEATAFHGLPDDTWEGLAAEARSLVVFLPLPRTGEGSGVRAAGRHMVAKTPFRRYTLSQLQVALAAPMYGTGRGFLPHGGHIQDDDVLWMG